MEISLYRTVFMPMEVFYSETYYSVWFVQLRFQKVIIPNGRYSERLYYSEIWSFGITIFQNSDRAEHQSLE